VTTYNESIVHLRANGTIFSKYLTLTYKYESYVMGKIKKRDEIFFFSFKFGLVSCILKRWKNIHTNFTSAATLEVPIGACAHNLSYLYELDYEAYGNEALLLYL
jgi:hypothetical protein